MKHFKYFDLIMAAFVAALLISNIASSAKIIDWGVAIEVLFTPATYGIVAFLKRAEHEDYYDKDTNFNPFAIAARE